ncbi:hypothetical protein MPH47_15040 [Psychrobacillus psychrodurans]|uniref:hypothetical protein n=1 Tax=Psychrobacillus psychrodurans TaxID=126157 RepID=UPI001F4D6E65|nr:hypothetical protein [Psychrobacillus psychrodurans]MCK1998518.1 hypothetical protein [Psychrobacillus psychrodurans]
MNENLIILEMFKQEVFCCCPGQKHQHIIEFHQGDVWTITNEQKYDDVLGWHFLVAVNREFQFLIQVDDIEKLFSEGRICSILDLELKIIHLNYQVNKALDEHDKESFSLYANELSNAKKVIDNGYFTVGIQAF